MTKRINVNTIPKLLGSSYPSPFDKECAKRQRQVLGDEAGLTQFGANLLILEPGVWSAQRHWHTSEDEFIYILEGEVVLVTDDGEEILKKGDCAGFKAGVETGHHLQNRSSSPAHVLEVGTRSDSDVAHYPDADLIAINQGNRYKFTNKAGEEY